MLASNSPSDLLVVSFEDANEINGFFQFGRCSRELSYPRRKQSALGLRLLPQSEYFSVKFDRGIFWPAQMGTDLVMGTDLFTKYISAPGFNLCCC